VVDFGRESWVRFEFFVWRRTFGSIYVLFPGLIMGLDGAVFEGERERGPDSKGKIAA